MTTETVDKKPPGIKIRHVRFVTKALILASPKEAEDAVPAREGDKVPKGYDIWYVPSRRAFRFDRYEDGKLWKVKWMHESRIDTWEEWDTPKD